MPRPWRLACLLALLASATATAGCLREYSASNSAGLGYIAFLDDSGSPAGFSADFYRELGRRVGCKIRYEVLPPLRQNALAEHDLTALLVPVVSRTRPEHLFVPLLAIPLDLIIRRDLNVRTVSAAKANANVVFGYISALSYGQWGNAFLDALPKDRLDDTPTTDALYRKLAVGRIGATFGYAPMYRRNLDIYQLIDTVRIIPVEETPRTVMGLVIVHKQVPPADERQLREAAESMRQDGTLARLLAHYLGDTVANDIVWRASRDPVPQ
ncbi:hypothetical protein [Chitinimonas sp.]|uniref:hypothetical protein n=1 Tax=Chitinimonas sp. TaxID=1934313 RepID=UPI0035B0A0BE